MYHLIKQYFSVFYSLDYVLGSHNFRYPLKRDNCSLESNTCQNSCNPICNYRFEGAHGEEVGHHRAESRRQAGLRDETELQLRQTNDVVAPLPVPARNVQEVGLREGW